jgi:uncharacterized metal-binding protein YceD (DUF177 family)
MIYNVSGLLKSNIGYTIEDSFNQIELARGDVYFNSVIGKIKLIKTDCSIWVNGSAIGDFVTFCHICLEEINLNFYSKFDDEYFPYNKDLISSKKSLSKMTETKDENINFIDKKNNINVSHCVFESLYTQIPITVRCEICEKK